MTFPGPSDERLTAPARQAGCIVHMHSDGDIRLVLDMLIDAGIEGINPLERRANMDIVKIHELYPKLILIGGMCNTKTLLRGTKEDVEAEAKAIIDIGRDGGIIIGSHSIGPEIPLENFVAYHETCVTYGNFSA